MAKQTPDTDAMYLLGYIFLMTDKLEKAQSVFEGLAEMQPSAYVRKLLAYTYLRLKMYDKALPETEAALAAKDTKPGENDKLLLMKAHALWGMGRKDEADRIVSQFFKEREARTKRNAQ